MQIKPLQVGMLVRFTDVSKRWTNGVKKIIKKSFSLVQTFIGKEFFFGLVLTGFCVLISVYYRAELVHVFAISTELVAPRQVFGHIVTTWSGSTGMSVPAAARTDINHQGPEPAKMHWCTEKCMFISKNLLLVEYNGR